MYNFYQSSTVFTPFCPCCTYIVHTYKRYQPFYHEFLAKTYVRSSQRPTESHPRSPPTPPPQLLPDLVLPKITNPNIVLLDGGNSFFLSPPPTYQYTLLQIMSSPGLICSKDKVRKRLGESVHSKMPFFSFLALCFPSSSEGGGSASRSQ